MDVTTKNIDTYALAKDYSAATLSKRIEEDANPDQVNFSLKDSYLLLGALLKDNDYKVKKESYTIRLKKVDKKWEFVSRDELDEAATGNFLGYMSDADLFTPEEIVKIHFDTLKSFDSEQLSRYLSLENFLVTDNSYNDHIGHVMAEQIHKNFDYEILSSKSDGHKATVKVKITSCDFKNIVTTYETELNAYLKTSKSLADGEEGRREKERQLLLDSIANNDAASTTEVTIQMINDGTSWKMQMTQEIAQAVLGGIDSALADISEDVE